ncbi:MAG TPA: RNA polymerase sigma-70 factor [Cyclobacteriaceae bacterium]|nr:RNA polymerase sigma-70 factor [Cyclobacteriaceae bacterium]
MDLLEKQVLETLQLGNESAFEMIFRTYYQPLCRYAYSFLQDKEEAEEVVQASFITVWEKRNNIAIETSLKSYLYRMVRNSCLNVIKHEKVKQQHVAHELAVSEVSHESVSQKVQAAELEIRITEAMKTLPEQCRLVFQLSRFEELKYQEIADQLQISVKTVENHMGKALKLMREQLKDYLPLFLIFMKDWI